MSKKDIWNEGWKRWWIPVGCVLIIASVTIVAYRQVNQPLGAVPINRGGDIVPTTGVAGFPVKEYCEDDDTKVTYSDIPGVGKSHELKRTKDGVTELVTVTIESDGTVAPATHYYSTAVGQDSEPADALDAKSCIEDKRVLKR